MPSYPPKLLKTWAGPGTGDTVELYSDGVVYLRRVDGVREQIAQETPPLGLVVPEDARWRELERSVEIREAVLKPETGHRALPWYGGRGRRGRRP